jgi:hypothetical protein
MIFPSNNNWNGWTKASWGNNPSRCSPKHSLITRLKEMTIVSRVITYPVSSSISSRSSSSSKHHSQRGNLQTIEPFWVINRTTIVLKRWKQQLHSQLGIHLLNYNSNISCSKHLNLNPKTNDHPPPMLLPLSHHDPSNNNNPINSSNSRKEVCRVI